MSSPGRLIRRAAVAVGIAALAVQDGLVAYEHLGPTRYFAWAPNDYVVQYRLTATVDGHRLSATGVRDDQLAGEQQIRGHLRARHPQRVPRRGGRLRASHATTAHVCRAWPLSR